MMVILMDTILLLHQVLVAGTLGVTGATTLASTLAVSGATGIDGDFDVNTNKFTVAASSGNTI